MTTKEAVKFGVAIPQIFQDGHVNMALVRESVIKAETMGYESVWVQEGIVGDVPMLESLSLLSYVAAISSNVRLGVSVLVTPLRHPVQLAKILGSIDQMSGGRLIVGVGVGPTTSYYPAFGIKAEERMGRFIEGLQVMKALWTESSAKKEGRFWQLDDVPMEPKPLQNPYPPIWFGGLHPNALARAVRHGDGWMGAGNSSTSQFKEGVLVIKRQLEEQKRDPATFMISKRVYLALDEDEKRGERRLREWYARSVYRNADRGSQVSVWGSPSRCIEALAELTTAGAQHLLLNPVFDMPDQIDRLSEEVIPHL